MRFEALNLFGDRQGSLKLVLVAAVIALTYFAGAVAISYKEIRTEQSSLIAMSESYVDVYLEAQVAPGALTPATFRRMAVERFLERHGQSSHHPMHIEIAGFGEVGGLASTGDPGVATVLLSAQDTGNHGSVRQFALGGDGVVTRKIVPIVATDQTCTNCERVAGTGGGWSVGDVMGGYVVETNATNLMIFNLAQAVAIFVFVLVALFFVQQVNADLVRRHEQARAEAQQLRLQATHADEQTKIQRDLISMVSHEFRTPLTIIEGHSDSLLRRLDTLEPEKISQRVTTIKSSVRRMVSLMETFLYASRLDAGKIAFSPSEVDLTTIMREACAEQSFISPSHEIICDVPEIEPTIADPQMVRQIMSNLLSNAVKYSPGKPVVEVRYTPDELTHRFAVRDYGLGIPEAEVREVFSRYFRSSTTTGIPGTGIGLDLSLQLAKSHHGRIEAWSKEGEGSRFTLVLPRREVLIEDQVEWAMPLAGAEPSMMPLRGLRAVAPFGS